MILSTVCYIEQDGKYLMLHSTKKKKDVTAQIHHHRHRLAPARHGQSPQRLA